MDINAGTIDGITLLSIANATTAVGLTVGSNVARTVPNLKLIGQSTDDNIDGGGGLEIGDGGVVYLRLFRLSSNNFRLLTGGSLTLTASLGVIVGSDLTMSGALDHNGSTVGLYGATPVVASAQAALTGTPQAGTFATGTVTLPQLAGVVMSMLTQFRLRGDFS